MTEPNSQGAGGNGRRDLGVPNPQILRFDDDGGDYTVKPIPPEWLPQAKAEWEKIQAWRASQKEAGAASNGQREYGLPEPQLLMFDGDGGDYTVKPIPPEMREKIHAWQAAQKKAGDTPEKK